MTFKLLSHLCCRW